MNSFQQYLKEKEAAKEKKRLATKKWREENPEKSKEAGKRQYYKRIAEKPDEHREYQRKNTAKWRAANPERVKEIDRLQKARSMEMRREKQYRKKYGISIQEFDGLFTSQGNCCALCKGGAGKNGWQVDHCHNTGNVRGILCHKCNLALGLLNDNTELLRAAINYLER